MKISKNTNKVFYAIFSTLPLLATLFLYPIIPDRIPVHYYPDGVIDGWGSKNQLFIVPLIIITFVLVQPRLFTLTFNHKQEDSITKYNNYFFLIILNILVYITLYISINYETCLNKFNFFNFFSCSLCLIFGFIGNYIPYSKRNSSFSIRTKCTLKNELIWRKVHNFCGLVWLSGSIVFFPMFIFNNGYYLTFITLLMLLIFIISPIIYIHYLNKKSINDKFIKKHKTMRQYHLKI
ncbi:DUF1648 domain-containing protein [Terrisporobacter sp.]|uniref:DUF1648 domain-containing protein n=1 Tax=Terrisporobacter sp. TaxID=1965305 RepID=UPI003FCD264A